MFWFCFVAFTSLWIFTIWVLCRRINVVWKFSRASFLNYLFRCFVQACKLLEFRIQVCFPNNHNGLSGGTVIFMDLVYWVRQHVAVRCCQLSNNWDRTTMTQRSTRQPLNESMDFFMEVSEIADNLVAAEVDVILVVAELFRNIEFQSKECLRSWRSWPNNHGLL